MFSGRFCASPVYQSYAALCWGQVFTHRCLSAGYSPSTKKKKSAKKTELDIHPYQTMYSFNCMNKKNLVADSLEPWLSNSHYSIANSFLFYTQG